MNTRVDRNQSLISPRPVRRDEQRLDVSAAALARSARAALRGWWQRLGMDERAAYLSQATSHADLEYRLRSWNSVEPRRRMPFP